MKFLVYGAGVIGSIFAAKLSAAGYAVTVLARGKRYDELIRNGIILQDAYSHKRKNYTVRVISNLEANESYDYVLVVMQKTQVAGVLPSLSQNKSPNIVFIVNNCLGYSEWAEAIGEDRLMLGFPSAGGERSNGVVTYFIGKGLSRLFQTTTFAEYRGHSSQRLKRLVTVFNRAGIPSVTCSNMDAWQKTHVSIVTSIGNALYKHGSNNYALAKAKEDLILMAGSLKEGFRVLKKLGVPVTPSKLGYFKLPDRLLAVLFSLIMNTRMAEVAMAKHTIAAKDEMIALQSDFDKLIEQSGLETPCIKKLAVYL